MVSDAPDGGGQQRAVVLLHAEHRLGEVGPRRGEGTQRPDAVVHDSHLREHTQVGRCIHSRKTAPGLDLLTCTAESPCLLRARSSCRSRFGRLLSSFSAADSSLSRIASISCLPENAPKSPCPPKLSVSGLRLQVAWRQFVGT